MTASEASRIGGQDEQHDLFEDASPAAAWDRDAANRALDELFTLAGRYRKSSEYHALLQFVARFRFYAPFNAMLVHLQMSGATYVAPAHRWDRKYGRRIKAGERPLVILQPMGPVMFVFDVSQTEPGERALPLPREVEQPFEVTVGLIGDALPRTVENAKRDGVTAITRQAGSQSAGQIGRVEAGRHVAFLVKENPDPVYLSVPLRYEVMLNSAHSSEARYATLAHELGHLYCGHLGTPDPRWWPDRRGLAPDVRELEAESVCYLLCARRGLDNPSAEYLSGYVTKHDETPAISLDRVMTAAGLIEQMGRHRLEPRKEKK